ncbi:MAG TPA: PilZ domain-containing protein [Nitrospirae bacterium]|nr:PilZ domain-containing protein [Nitrospirota bacterium]
MIFFERRRHKRIEKTNEIEFIKITNNQKEVINKGKLVDISQGGVGIVTDFVLLKGQPLILKGASENDMLTYGVVCWTQRQNNVIRSGIRFNF